MNVIILDIPFHEGMAGTKRVKNLMLPLYQSKEISLSNLAMTNVAEKELIGKSGCIDGIDFKFIGYSSFKNIASVIKFYKEGMNFIKTHIKGAEKNIVYYYGYPDLKNLLFIIYARYKKCKIIFDIVEDNRHFKHFLGLAGKIRNQTSVFLLKQIHRFGDSVIVISKPLEIWLNSLCANKIKVHNIPITVDIKSVENSANNSSEEGGLINIFYGGSFANKDGLEYLLQAFNNICKKHQNVQLMLTGAGQVADMEKVFEVINHNSKINFLGFLSTEEYYKVLKNSDICCMTRNNSEYANAGFPFKLGEFLAAGKAIVATEVGDVPLYLSNQVNALLIPPESVEAIENALLIYIENKDGIRQRLGMEAQKTAKKYFDDTMLSKQLLEIFKDV